MTNEFTKEIVEHIGVLSAKDNGWKKELNVVIWNHREPKLDIREWNEDHNKCTKGVVLTAEEAENLAMILHNYIQERKSI